jgi:hypothetical protein
MMAQKGSKHLEDSNTTTTTAAAATATTDTNSSNNVYKLTIRAFCLTYVSNF